MRLQRTLPHGNTVLLSYSMVTVQLTSSSLLVIIVQGSLMRARPQLALHLNTSNRLCLKPRHSLQGLLSARTCQNAIDYRFYIALHVCAHSGAQMPQYDGAALCLACSHSSIACTAARAAFAIYCSARTCQNATGYRIYVVLKISVLQDSDTSLSRSRAIPSS